MTRTIFLMAAGLLGSGCGDSKNDDDDTGAGAGNASGEGTGCQVVEETPLDLDGTTPTGASVADAAAILEAEHAATLTWNDGTTTALTVTITDVSNPRFEDHEAVWGSGPIPSIDLECSDQLVFDIQLSIVTADGQLSESLAHTAAQVDGATSPSIFVDLSSVTGSFDPADWTDETFDRLAANLTASWSETGIQGLIDGYGETEGEHQKVEVGAGVEIDQQDYSK